jgi:hypothetical protein
MNYNTENIQKGVKFHTLPHPARLPTVNINLSQDISYSTNYFYNIYTDGSKTEVQTSAAFTIYKNYCETHFENYRLNDNCSVEKALNFIKNTICDENKTIGLFSDSKSALQVIKTNSTNYLVNSIRCLISNKEHKFKNLEPEPGEPRLEILEA